MANQSKPQSLIAFLRTVHPNTKPAEAFKLAKDAGFKSTTIYSVRSTLAAVRKERRDIGSSKPAANGYTLPTRAADPMPRGEHEITFARLVARIGTDRARQLLELAEQRDIT